MWVLWIRFKSSHSKFLSSLRSLASLILHFFTFNLVHQLVLRLHFKYWFSVSHWLCLFKSCSFCLNLLNLLAFLVLLFQFNDCLIICLLDKISYLFLSHLELMILLPQPLRCRDCVWCATKTGFISDFKPVIHC